MKLGAPDKENKSDRGEQENGLRLVPGGLVITWYKVTGEGRLEGKGGMDIDKKLKAKCMGVCMLLIRTDSEDMRFRTLLLTPLLHQPGHSSG